MKQIGKNIFETGFDFDLTLLPFPVVPSIDQVPVGDHRSYEDRRTFLEAWLARAPKRLANAWLAEREASA